MLTFLENIKPHLILLMPYQTTMNSFLTCFHTPNCNFHKLQKSTPQDFPIISMIGCDNFCYYVVLAWRLFANGLLIFNLPQAFQKIFTYSFLLVVVHYLKFSLLSSVARWQMWVCVSIHLFSWQSLIFALKLENFHHFSICCCRTCNMPATCS